MPYIKKTDEKLEVIENIPASYGMISNYHLLDIETHNKDGFFLLDTNEPTVASDEDLIITENEYILQEDNTYKRKYEIRKKEPQVRTIFTSEEQFDLDKRNILLERYNRLAISDWVELPSVVSRMDPELHAKWMAYREALRECVNVADPKDVVFPVAPHSPLLGTAYPHGFLNK